MPSAKRSSSFSSSHHHEIDVVRRRSRSLSVHRHHHQTTTTATTKIDTVTMAPTTTSLRRPTNRSLFCSFEALMIFQAQFSGLEYFDIRAKTWHNLYELLSEMKQTFNVGLTTRYRAAHVDVHTNDKHIGANIFKMVVNVLMTSVADYDRFVASVANGVLLHGFITTAAVTHMPRWTTKGVLTFKMLYGYSYDKNPAASRETFVKALAASNTRRSSVGSLKGAALTSIYLTHLRNAAKKPFDFFDVIRQTTGREPDERDVMLVNTHRKENALHLAFREGRTNFAEMIYHLGVWSELRGAYTITHEHATPMRIAYSKRLEILYQNLDYLCDNDHYRLVSSWTTKDIRSVYRLPSFAAQGKTAEVRNILKSDRWLRLSDGAVQHTIAIRATILASLYGRTPILRLLCDTYPLIIRRRLIFVAQTRSEMCKIRPSTRTTNTNTMDSSTVAPIGVSASQGDTRTLRMLSEEMGYRFAMKALVSALCNGRREAYDYISSRVKRQGRWLNILRSPPDDRGNSLLHYAVIANDIPLIGECWHAANNDMGILTATNVLGSNVAHLAVKSSTKETLAAVLELMVETGGRIVERMLSAQDRTAGKSLHCIMGFTGGRPSWKWVEIERLKHQLFSKALSGGKLNDPCLDVVVDKGFGRRRWADMSEKVAIWRQRNENRRRYGKNDDMTPLHYAARRADPSFARAILSAGGDWWARDSDGGLALHHAIVLGHAETVKCLWRNCCSNSSVVEETSVERELSIAIHLATANEQMEIAKILLVPQRRSMNVEMTIETIKTYLLAELVRLQSEIAHVPQQVELEQTKEQAEKIAGIFNTWLMELVVNGELGAPRLETLMKSGGDIRQHLIDQVGHITWQINVYLIAVGLSPIDADCV